jgi:RHS repeat-associated protein
LTKYGYNNDDLRVSKTVQDSDFEFTDREHYTHDGDQLVLTFDQNLDGTDPAAGYLQNRYLYAPGIDELLTDENFGGRADTGVTQYDLLWAATDHVGSVRQLVDDDHTVVEHREFDSFGTITAVFDELGDPKESGGQPDLAALDSVFAFAGREWDNDVGLYYNRARWLDPRIGRFLSEDPLGFEGGDTNLYRYAANNPFLFTDSTGLSWLSDLFDGIGDFFEDTFKQVGNFVNNTSA